MEPDLERLLETAGRRLSDAVGRRTRLRPLAALSHENTVLRCATVPALPGGAECVVVKQVTSLEFNRPGSSAESQRFLNEWACLEFLTSLPGPRLAPGLVAADRSASLLILEDLGEHPTVQDLLLGDDAAAARRALAGVGTTLGRLQRATRGRVGDLAAAQERLGTVSPSSDSTIDVREWSARLTECCDALGFEPARGFWTELDGVENEIHGDGPFAGFVHGDAGPHNFLRIPGNLRMLDFEFGAVRNGLSDLVSARLGFPQTTRSQAVPSTDATSVEDAWRAEIAPLVPEAGDDSVFGASLTAAAAHWALVAWGGLWQRHVRRPGDDPDANDAAARGRANALTLHEGFLRLAAATGKCGLIAATLDRYVAAQKKMWPGLESMPDYPALARR